MEIGFRGAFRDGERLEPPVWLLSGERWHLREFRFDLDGGRPGRNSFPKAFPQTLSGVLEKKSGHLKFSTGDQNEF